MVMTRYKCPRCGGNQYSADPRKENETCIYCDHQGTEIMDSISEDRDKKRRPNHMKAITLWQPWAQLIVQGDKLIETRGYNTNIRGRVAIHAAKSDHSGILLHIPMSELAFFQEAGVTGIKEPPRGVVVGTVEIIDSWPIEELIGTGYDTPKERAFGDWSPGRWGWILQKPVLFDKPIPAKGAQGFWNWEGER